PERNSRAANAVARSLTRNDAFADVLQQTGDLLDNGQQQAAQTLFSEDRFHLLAPAYRAALARLAQPPTTDDMAARRHFIRRAQAALYGIGVGAGTTAFIEDPLGLSAAYRSARLTHIALPGLRLADNGHFYVTNEQGRRFAVIFAASRRDPFTTAAQAAQLAAPDDARHAAKVVAPDATLLVSGVLPHAAAATEQARSEVSLIGKGSLAGILLLMLWAFGSIRPFLLSLTAMAGGCLLAIVATTAIFGPIHIITLV